jgi:ABC-type uncharacterized transport system permease subunit
MDPKFFVGVAIAAYAAGAVLSFVSIGRAKYASSWPHLALALVGLLAQMIGLSVHCSASETHYFTSPMEILWLLAWSVGVNYVVILTAWRIAGLGLLVLPLNVALLAASLLAQFPGPAPVSGVDRHSLYAPHVLLAFLGYGFFLSACAISILYLRAEWLLKHKVFGAVLQGMPSLERLERTAGRCVWAGFALFSVALAQGAYLAHTFNVSSWFLHPKMLAAEITWLVFLVLVVGRLARRLIGRLAAQTVLVGAALVGFTILLSHPLKSDADGNPGSSAAQEKLRP